MTVSGTKAPATMDRLHQSYQHLRLMARVLRGRDLWPTVQLSCATVSLGSEGARWCICPEGLSENSVVYCLGVGEEISFDLELVKRFGAQVHAFDPTPRSIQWVRSQTLPDKFVFHEYGAAEFDGTCRFVPPKDPKHVSHTMLPRESPWPAIQAPVFRLSTIMKMLGHSEIDLLKMDIEGAEYSVLADLLASDIRPHQILVEFHHRWREVGSEKTRSTIRGLNQAGYRIFSISPSGEEYSFKLSPKNS
jgi:FkbM family methyltransferase